MFVFLLILIPFVAYGEETGQFVDLLADKDPVADIVYKMLFAAVFLIMGSFSLWYAGRLALIRHITYKTAFLITLITYVLLGIIRTGMVMTGVYVPGMLWIPILIAVTFEIFLAKFILRSTWVKTVIAVILGNIMTALIVLPVFVVAGSLWAYFLASKGG
ncbi:hypothetical protein [Persephonella sp.]|uniref:hypothetical protein n=1 Tax=Persephonella sp. TaxID=2060922 RepID=UPI0025FF21E5|nr:hypothetical protein [Persephonella sp.]